MAPIIRFRRSLLLAAALAPAVMVTGCVQSMLRSSAAVQGSGRQASEERTVPAFDRIVASGALTLDVKTGNKTKLSLSAEDNILPLIKTEVKDGTLHIRTTGSYNSSSTMSVTITTPHIKSVNMEGACSASCAGIHEPSLDVDLSGACHLKAEGTADRMKVELNGASSADLSNLKAKDARVAVDGAGSATVDVSGKLDASASGVGKVEYLHKPASLKTSVSGVGGVHQREGGAGSKPTD